MAVVMIMVVMEAVMIMATIIVMRLHHRAAPYCTVTRLRHLDSPPS